MHTANDSVKRDFFRTTPPEPLLTYFAFIVLDSSNSFYYPDLWWKRDHVLILKEDPGLQVTKFALGNLARSKFADDNLALQTAEASRAGIDAQLSYEQNLHDLLLPKDIQGDSSEEEDESKEYYPPTAIDPGQTSRGLATLIARGPDALEANAVQHSQVFGGGRKRKTSVPVQIVAKKVKQDIEELESLPSFAELGATALSCDFCHRWRFVCPHYHDLPDMDTLEDADKFSFQCWKLNWKDGTPVGLSCESEEQSWRPLNPEDPYAMDREKAKDEMRNFFAWWASTSDDPSSVDLTDVSVYREHYWEYLAHIGTIVPEGYADLPTNLHVKSAD
eukprot:9504165-Pyramimonas_sp.AAC.3